jgi:hypothetical protein
MLSASKIIKSWVEDRVGEFSKIGWSVELQLPDEGSDLNKAGFVIEREERSVSVTLWGTGMLEIIFYDDQTDDVSSSDIELASEQEILNKLDGLLL